MPDQDQTPTLIPSNIVSLGKPGITCTELREVNKGALVGFATLSIDAWNLTLVDCKWFRKGPAEWVGMPSSSYTNRDGKTVYKDLVFFSSKESAERFKAAALHAIHSFS